MIDKNNNKKLSKSLEDYLEAVLLVSNERKVVRVKDLVSMLKVKSPSVNNALKKLKGLGFISYEPYGYIELTKVGKKEADIILKKHKLISKFLTSILGVDKKIAEKDACMMEHEISKETQKGLISFMKNRENEIK